MTMELPIACAASCIPHCVIQFLCAKKSPPIEINHELIEMYGRDVMTVQHVRKWFHELCEGRPEVHDEPQSGKPRVSTEDTLNIICAIVEDDQRVSVPRIKFLMKGKIGTPF